ncbi:MAG: hypothetical protein CL483_12750 [Acidobacteria bacterium]|nr:hypothetical protein [Acidobacteriota bacterium]
MLVRRTKSLIGLDIGLSAVKAVELRQTTVRRRRIASARTYQSTLVVTDNAEDLPTVESVAIAIS